MLLSILFYLFVAVGLINMAHIAAYLIGGNIYDTTASKRLRLYSSKSRKRFRNPLVSVLIPAYNEALVINRCLDSIRKSSYKKVEVMVNNDASKDLTEAVVRRYKKRFPGFNLRLVNRRNNGGKAAGLNYLAKHYASGDLVMTLDADSYLHKDSIRNVIKYFDDPEVVGVAANVRIQENLSALGVLQRFEHMVAYRSKKLFSVINSELIIGGVGSTYRRSTLKRVHYYDTDTVTEDIGLSIKIAAQGNKSNRLMYASDVLAFTEGVSNFKALFAQRFRWKLGNLQNLLKYRRLLFSRSKKYSLSLTWYRVPMAFLGEIIILLEPVVLGYVLYLSVRTFSPALILSAYIAISAYLLLVILPDEHLSSRKKIETVFYIPFMYFLFYIMNFVQLISALKCIANGKKIVGLSHGSNTWVSPGRSGKAATYY